jgi:hypothetical protein
MFARLSLNRESLDAASDDPSSPKPRYSIALWLDLFRKAVSALEAFVYDCGGTQE